jgi:hypothetical protein
MQRWWLELDAVATAGVMYNLFGGLMIWARIALHVLVPALLGWQLDGSHGMMLLEGVVLNPMALLFVACVLFCRRYKAELEGLWLTPREDTAACQRAFQRAQEALRTWPARVANVCAWLEPASMWYELVLMMATMQRYRLLNEDRTPQDLPWAVEPYAWPPAVVIGRGSYVFKLTLLNLSWLVVAFRVAFMSLFWYSARRDGYMQKRCKRRRHFTNMRLRFKADMRAVGLESTEFLWYYWLRHQETDKRFRMQQALAVTQHAYAADIIPYALGRAEAPRVGCFRHLLSARAAVLGNRRLERGARLPPELWNVVLEYVVYYP